MSDTRPPITAGPIERAFRFLKSTSVSWAGVGEGVGIGDKDGDTVAVGVAAAVDTRLGCVSSCAGKLETAQIKKSKAQKHISRLVMTGLPSRSAAVEQGLRLPFLCVADGRPVPQSLIARPMFCDASNRCNLVTVLTYL